MAVKVDTVSPARPAPSPRAERARAHRAGDRRDGRADRGADLVRPLRTRGKYYVSVDDAYIRADAVTVSPKISGYVDQVLVADNQDVTAGQPLARIDARDYTAQTAQYRAQIDVSKANAANVQAGILEQRSAIEQARAQLASSREAAAYATGEVQRYAPLAESGAESREKLASLRNQATQAASTVAAQTAALTAAERRVASLEAQVRQADAQGESAQAQLAAANVNVGSALIRAPMAGRIGDKSVRVGQFVQPGVRMMSVVPLQAIYISANFKETQVGLMRPGQPATIEVDALPGVELHRPCREPRARHRLRILAAASPECDGQFPPRSSSASPSASRSTRAPMRAACSCPACR